MRFNAHDRRVQALAWTPDGRLVSGSADGTALVWDLDRAIGVLEENSDIHAAILTGACLGLFYGILAGRTPAKDTQFAVFRM